MCKCHAYMCEYIHVGICIYIYVCVCVCVCVYIYIYIWKTLMASLWFETGGPDQLKTSDGAVERRNTYNTATLIAKLISRMECPSKCLEWVNEVTQSCPTLFDPMDGRQPGSSIHGILQARKLEWVATAFLRGSSQPRDQTQVSRIAGRRFTPWATREAAVNALVDHKS